jgi:hypothetical protein
MRSWPERCATARDQQVKSERSAPNPFLDCVRLAAPVTSLSNPTRPDHIPRE